MNPDDPSFPTPDELKQYLAPSTISAAKRNFDDPIYQGAIREAQERIQRQEQQKYMEALGGAAKLAEYQRWQEEQRLRVAQDQAALNQQNAYDQYRAQQMATQKPYVSEAPNVAQAPVVRNLAAARTIWVIVTMQRGQIEITARCALDMVPPFLRSNQQYYDDFQIRYDEARTLSLPDTGVKGREPELGEVRVADAPASAKTRSINFDEPAEVLSTTSIPMGVPYEGPATTMTITGIDATMGNITYKTAPSTVPDIMLKGGQRITESMGNNLIEMAKEYWNTLNRVTENPSASAGLQEGPTVPLGYADQGTPIGYIQVTAEDFKADNDEQPF